MGQTAGKITKDKNHGFRWRCSRRNQSNDCQIGVDMEHKRQPSRGDCPSELKFHGESIHCTEPWLWPCLPPTHPDTLKLKIIGSNFCSPFWAIVDSESSLLHPYFPRAAYKYIHAVRSVYIVYTVLSTIQYLKIVAFSFLTSSAMKFRRKLRALALLALSASWRSRSFAFGPAPPTPDANAETAEGTETAPPTGPLLLGREQWQFHQWRAETDAGSGGFGVLSEVFCFDIFGYGSIPINTIFSGMNIHLPAILMWTTGVQGFDTLPYLRKGIEFGIISYYYYYNYYHHISILCNFPCLKKGWRHPKWLPGWYPRWNFNSVLERFDWRLRASGVCRAVVRCWECVCRWGFQPFPPSWKLNPGTVG